MAFEKTKSIKLAANCVIARLIDAPKKVIDLVAELLSYRVEGAEFMGTTNWSGRSSFYSRRNDTFPAGFVYLVHAELRRRGYAVQIIMRPHVEPLGPASPIVDEFGNDNPDYDFQMKALAQVEKHGRGIVQVATGGGKSKIAKLVAARYRRMTMFLTTRGILLYQMADGFKSAGMNVGIIGDGVWSPVRGVNCGMVQTFIARLEEPDLNAEIRALVKSHASASAKAEKKGLPPPATPNRAALVKLATAKFDEKTKTLARHVKLLEMVEVVIGEEAHEAGGDSYYKILRHCKNASIRVALTATPFMRDDAEDNMRLMAAFGPVLIQVSEKLLIDRGVLSTPSFKFHVSKAHPKLHRTSPWQRAYQLGYMENRFMHLDIVAEAKMAAERKLPVMTLVQRTDHGDVLSMAMRDAGLRVEFIRGDNDQVERKQALRRLAKGEIDVLIGTTILDVGVDMPAIGLVQLAGGGKAQVALRQRIGRAMRRKKKGPNVCFVTDYSVELNEHLKGHSQTRRAIIEATPGFGERIIPKGGDHFWRLFDKVTA